MGSFRHPRPRRRATKQRLPRRAKVFGAFSLGSFGFVFARVVLWLFFAVGKFWAVLGNGPGHAPIISFRLITCSLVNEQSSITSGARARLTHACARNFSES